MELAFFLFEAKFRQLVIIGLVIAVFQTLTSIQEMTLTFVPKIIVIFGAILVFMPFMMTSLIEFTRELFDRIAVG